MKELAADGIPVGVTCRVLTLARQPYYRWLANPITDAEWEEFEEHFTLRRVELGSCARPYGSRCEHEHACLRCPVLRVDPAQLDRLAAIITNLEERIVEAEERGWPGEVAQLTVTVKAARDKLARHTPTGPSTAHGLTLLPHPTTRALQDAKGG